MSYYAMAQNGALESPTMNRPLATLPFSWRSGMFCDSASINIAPEAKIMPDPLSTPKEVASKLDISPSTLRAWSVKFAGILSENANPPKEASGRVGRRLYAPEDLAILARAKELLASGLTFERALTVLRTEPEPGPAALAAVQDNRALAVPELVQAIQVIADQKTKLDDLEARVSELEKSRRRRWWPFGR
jgi:DNA-binding transcriptional MerR regulator